MGVIILGSNLEETRKAGRYKVAFLDYLRKADELCRSKILLDRCAHLRDMQRAYGNTLITVSEYREEFISLCEILRNEYGFVSNFDEAFSRVEIDHELRKADEEIAFERLQLAIHKCFKATKIVYFYNDCRGTVDLRYLLLLDDDAKARRECFRRLLLREGDAFSPTEMAAYFRGEVYNTYSV